MQKLSKYLSDPWMYVWILILGVAAWFAWPYIGMPIRHALDGIGRSAGRVHATAPAPVDMSHHVYRSVPLRITFMPEVARHNDFGNIVSTPWGGEWGIPRESPTVSGTVVANGTRVHDAYLHLMTCPSRTGTCAFHWDVTVEFADNSSHLTVTLNEHLMGVISHGTSLIGTVSRPVVDGGLIVRNGHPVDTYAHIPVRAGQLFIEQTGPVNLPPVEVASAP